MADMRIYVYTGVRDNSCKGFSSPILSHVKNASIIAKNVKEIKYKLHKTKLFDPAGNMPSSASQIKPLKM